MRLLLRYILIVIATFSLSPQLYAKPNLCALLFSSSRVASESTLEKKQPRVLSHKEASKFERTAKAVEHSEDSRAFRLHLSSTVSSAILTFLTWKLTGLPIPTYLPQITFRSPRINIRYNKIRNLFHWALVGASGVFLVNHPEVISYFADAFLATKSDFSLHQNRVFDLNESQQMLWESWKQAFYDFEGRWPDPNKFPQDANEWSRELDRIKSLSSEDIKVNFDS